MLLIGVSKKHDNNGKRRHYQDKGKHWRVYFYDENGIFCTKRVTWFEGAWIKLTKRKVKKINDN